METKSYSCPLCSGLQVHIEGYPDKRVITINMKHLYDDTFICPNCDNKFEIHLAFTNIVEVENIVTVGGG